MLGICHKLQTQPVLRYLLPDYRLDGISDGLAMAILAS